MVTLTLRVQPNLTKSKVHLECWIAGVDGPLNANDGYILSYMTERTPSKKFRNPQCYCRAKKILIPFGTPVLEAA